MKFKAVIKKKFLNPDGTINKTVVASFITLLIVLIQQVMMAFGFTYLRMVTGIKWRRLSTRF